MILLIGNGRATTTSIQLDVRSPLRQSIHFSCQRHKPPCRRLALAGVRWKPFTRIHWRVLAAPDVFMVEVATWHGLVLIATEREPLLDLDEIGNGTKTNVVHQG